MTLRNWIKLHLHQIMAVLLWIGLIIGLYLYLNAHNLTLVEAAKQVEELMAENWYGPVIYLIIFILRPFTLIPAIVMVAVGGRIFDIGLGFLYGLTFMSLSAIMPYYAGTIFARGKKRRDEINKARQVARRIGQIIKDNPYESLIALRMTNFVYDIVSFVAGNLGVRFRVFFRATVLGNISIAFAFASLGASLEGDIYSGDLRIDPVLAISSLLVLAISAGVARFLRKRHEDRRARRANASSQFDTPNMEEMAHQRE